MLMIGSSEEVDLFDEVCHDIPVANGCVHEYK